jgi:hypothetical protein
MLDREESLSSQRLVIYRKLLLLANGTLLYSRSVPNKNKSIKGLSVTKQFPIALTTAKSKKRKQTLQA